MAFPTELSRKPRSTRRKNSDVSCFGTVIPLRAPVILSIPDSLPCVGDDYVYLGPNTAFATIGYNVVKSKVNMTVTDSLAEFGNRRNESGHSESCVSLPKRTGYLVGALPAQHARREMPPQRQVSCTTHSPSGYADRLVGRACGSMRILFLPQLGCPPSPLRIS